MTDVVQRADRSPGLLGVALVSTIVVLWVIRAAVQVGTKAVVSVSDSRRYEQVSSIGGAAGTVLSLIAGVMAIVLLVRAAGPDRREFVGELAVFFAIALQVPGYFLSQLLAREPEVVRAGTGIDPGSSLDLLIGSFWAVTAVGVAVWMVSQKVSIRSALIGVGGSLIVCLLGVGLSFAAGGDWLSADASGLIWLPAVCGLAAFVAGGIATWDERER